jgi:two-component system, cell cycle response regulator DivK
MVGTALIVDDNKLNLETLAALLKKEAMGIIGILNPHDIFPKLDEVGHVDVIFLDIEFPNQSGFDILRELQTDPRLQGVPIVAYSVHITELQEIRNAGFDGFIGKPLDVSAFPDQLHRILNGESVWEAGR